MAKIHRWKIIQKHPEIPYKVKQKEFADKWAAIAWMCSNQLGRRNLNDKQRTYLMGKEYEAKKNTHGGNRKPHVSSSPQNEEMKSGESKSTNGISAEIAEEHGVGHATVERAERFAKGLDEAEKVSPQKSN